MMKRCMSYNKFIRNVIFLSMFFIIGLFLLYSNFIQSSSIEKSIKEDTNIMAKLVFQNLYTVMKMGGDKELINETIVKIEKDISHINVDIVRNNDKNSKTINDAFLTKEPQILKKDKTLEFVTPILFKQECLQCHKTSNVDDVAGVLIIEHSILDIKISLKDIIVLIFILFILIILVFFTTWIYFLRKYFIQPINNLIGQISKHTTYKDLKNEIIIDTNIKEIKLLEKAFNIKNRALYSSSNKLEKASNKDHLTGIYNRRKFNEYSTLIINDAQRYEHTFSLILIDLNKFKPVNDTYGHTIGDKVLIYFTQIINKSIRETDYLFRIGGDEFYLLLSNTSHDEAIIIVKKLRDKLKHSKFIHGNITLEISASFGIAQYKLDGSKIEDLIKIADERMYKNKKLDIAFE
jgi:c-di-GMP phosphodiesterase